MPTVMEQTSLGGSTTGEYALFADRDGSDQDGVQPSLVRYFDFSGSATYPSSGESRFGVIMAYGDSSNMDYFFMASSGSAPNQR